MNTKDFHKDAIKRIAKSLKSQEEAYIVEIDDSRGAVFWTGEDWSDNIVDAAKYDRGVAELIAEDNMEFGASVRPLYR